MPKIKEVIPHATSLIGSLLRSKTVTASLGIPAAVAVEAAVTTPFTSVETATFSGLFFVMLRTLLAWHEVRTGAKQ